MKTRNVNVLLSAAIVLLMSWTITSCSKKKDAVVTPVDKTALTTSISTASTLLASTSEGVAAGNYLRGSQTPFAAAIQSAESVATLTTASQTDVNGAVANLASASTSYSGNLVVGIDQTDLVGQWTFDQVVSAVADATVKDYSGNNHDGKLKLGSAHWGGTGVAELVQDRYGDVNKALHFDLGQNVEIPYNVALNPGIMSISLWAKQDVETNVYPDQYMVSLDRWNAYKFQMDLSPTGFFTAHYVTGPDNYFNEVSSDAPLAQGIWRNLVVTFGNGHMTFYVNGALSKDYADVGTIMSISAAPVNLVFAQDLPTSVADDAGGYFHGALDEIRIYKSVLTPAQVTSIYNLEKP